MSKRIPVLRILSEKMLLSPEILEVLDSGIRQGASDEEESHAERLLQRIVSIGSQALPARKPKHKKPGPRGEEKINPVEEDLKRLWENIRALLDLPSRTPKPKAIATLARVLENANLWLKNHVFFTSVDFNSINLIQNRISKNEEGNSQCLRMLRQFKENLVRCGPVQFEFADLKIKTENNAKPPSDEREAYECFANLMELDLGILVRSSIEKNSQKLGENDIFDKPEAQDVLREKLEKIAFNRCNILRAAQARLWHLRTLFLDVEYAINDGDLRSIQCYLSNGQSHTDIIQLRLNNLQEIIFHAIERQGVSPFTNEALERVNLDPKPLREGVTFTGGYNDMRRASRLEDEQEILASANTSKKMSRDKTRVP